MLRWQRPLLVTAAPKAVSRSISTSVVAFVVGRSLVKSHLQPGSIHTRVLAQKKSYGWRRNAMCWKSRKELFAAQLKCSSLVYPATFSEMQLGQNQWSVNGGLCWALRRAGHLEAHWHILWRAMQLSWIWHYQKCRSCSYKVCSKGPKSSEEHKKSQRCSAVMDPKW